MKGHQANLFLVRSEKGYPPNIWIAIRYTHSWDLFRWDSHFRESRQGDLFKDTHSWDLFSLDSHFRESRQGDGEAAAKEPQRSPPVRAALQPFKSRRNLSGTQMWALFRRNFVSWRYFGDEVKTFLISYDPAPPP